MQASEMRGLGAEELAGRIREWEEQLFRYRCEKKIGQLENTNLLQRTRRDIARAKTVLNEKQPHAASQ